MVKPYVPKRGDVVWLNFSPQAGREQAGHRPGFVLSPAHYNQHGMILICPITSKGKGYPFEVPIKSGKIAGYVLADHIKHQDYQARGLTFATHASPEVLHKVQQIILGLMLN